ncbi:MAG TPA: GNAT family N-acetyltransferase [Vicinamibacterales bacterium]|nr:GNAT family N-acetyltransferase [Vicinamibacterales bacterium]
MFVEPNDWKRGIGRALVDHCVYIGRARGASFLHVIGNPHVRGFYLLCGFTMIGTVETQFGPGLSMQLVLG